MSHSNCLCNDGWRFEATDLATGVVKAILHPISADWEEVFSNVGTGTLMCATRDLAANDIWPHETGLYISQVNSDGSRRPRFGGYVEKFNGESGGATSVGLQSMDEYLNHRMVADEDSGLTISVIEDEGGAFFISTEKPIGIDGSNFTIYAYPEVFDITETQRSGMAGYILSLANPRGIPLSYVLQPPYALFDENYREGIGIGLIKWWDFKNIGAWLQEQVGQENGIKYRLEHVYTDPGQWATRMILSLESGLSTSRSYTLKSDREGWQYGLEVDGIDQADRVFGIGSGNDDTTTFSTAYDGAGRLPEFQAAPAWKDVNGSVNDPGGPILLDTLARGYVSDHRDAISVPSMTIAGLDWSQRVPPPEELLPGDEVGIEIGYGVITVRDLRAKVLSVGWKLEVGSPVTRTLAMLPVIRPADSIRTQVSARLPAPEIDENDSTTSDNPDLGPEPEPALVTKVKPNDLGEISGMQYATTLPGNVWVHNDENNATKQVSLIGLEKGNRRGSYSPSGPARVDPESIRLNPVTGELVLFDIGDNLNSRTSRRLFFTPQPTTGGDHGVIPSTNVRINYPFGAKNAETGLISPSGEIIVATKEQGRVRFVSFGTSPTDNMTGTVIGNSTELHLVSDGCFTPNGKWVLLRAKGVGPTTVFDATTWKKAGTIKTPALQKGESITMEPDGRSFLVGSEGVDSPIYRVVLPKKYRK